jgi:predicted nuclease of predicted toxin-antitoxin system
MRILPDECIPVALKRNLSSLGHECQTVRDAGFAGEKNGELLTLAEGRWDVLLTTDRKIEYQQGMIGRKIGILVLRAKTNRLRDLPSILPICAQALLSIRHGRVVEVAMSEQVFEKIYRCECTG